MSNSNEFLTAAGYAKKLNKSPTNDELLSLYKYYKQSVVGNNDTTKPGLLNIRAKAKWEAWTSVKDLSKHNSEVEYIKLVNEMIKKYGVN